MGAAVNALDGGLASPVFDTQAMFRAVMDAMACPARAVRFEGRANPPGPMTPLVGTLAATLIDADAPVWLDARLARSRAVSAWLGFHTGAAFTKDAGEAAFALIADPSGMPPLGRFAQGTQEYPDRSATLVLQLDSLDGGVPLAFRGPGIRTEAVLAPRGLPQDFAEQWMENARRFPRGVDLILTAGDRLACLPRSARIAGREG